MHSLLLFSDIITDKYDYDWSQYVFFTNFTGTRVSTHDIIQTRSTNKAKCRKNFWYIATNFVNKLNHVVDFFSSGLKQRLTNLYWSHFLNNYNELDACSWRLMFCNYLSAEFVIIFRGLPPLSLYFV